MFINLIPNIIYILFTEYNYIIYNHIYLMFIIINNNNLIIIYNNKA